VSAPVSDPSTTSLTTVREDRRGEARATAGRTVALLCLAAVLLEATADLLPDEPVVWVLTPARLVLGAGLVAAAVAGVRPGQWRTPLDPAIAALLLAAV
jgi:hypothetical protein